MNNPYAFADLFKNAFDLNQVFATQRRNIEAISAANQAIVEGAQAVARHNAESVREGVENMLKASRELFTGGSPENNVAKQAELSREIFQTALENVREATETLTKCGFEAFDVLNKRCTESLDELSKASGPAKKKAA